VKNVRGSIQEMISIKCRFFGIALRTWYLNVTWWELLMKW